MATTIKLYFRLDYPVNFDFMDSPGKALRLFGDLSGKVWKTVGDGQVPRSFVADHREKGVHRHISMEPKTLTDRLPY